MRDVEIIFSVIENIKKNNKPRFLKGISSIITSKQHCKILTFEYPYMSRIITPKNFVFFHNAYTTESKIHELPIYYFQFSRPFFHHYNPTI